MHHMPIMPRTTAPVLDAAASKPLPRGFTPSTSLPIHLPPCRLAGGTTATRCTTATWRSWWPGCQASERCGQMGQMGQMGQPRVGRWPGCRASERYVCSLACMHVARTHGAHLPAKAQQRPPKARVRSACTCTERSGTHVGGSACGLPAHWACCKRLAWLRRACCYLVAGLKPCVGVGCHARLPRLLPAYCEQHLCRYHSMHSKSRLAVCCYGFRLAACRAARDMGPRACPPCCGCLLHCS